MADNPDYKIGRFTLKPFRQLLDAGTPVPIGRKALDLLSVLAKAKGALVTKDELMAAVWPKMVVEDNAIQVHIAALRKALGKEAELLSTVHGLGYRLSATEAGAEPHQTMAGALSSDGLRARTPRARAILFGTMALIAIIGGAAWLLLPPSHSKLPAISAPALPDPKGVSVAVLPFLNLSPDKGQEFFSDGMTEEVTSVLAKVPGLTVIGRTSAFQFKGENRDMRAIGRALGAKNLIEGSVRREGDEVRITVQLIRAEDGAHLWAESYNRKLSGIFAVQEDIATAITGALQVPLGLSQGQTLVSSRTDDLDAYQQYLHARAFYRARDTDEAISILNRVVARDPNYAPAWALLSHALSLPRQFAGVQKEADAGDMNKARLLAQSILGRAEKAAREAIRLDPRLAMGYSALSPVELARGNWAAAEDAIRKALSLDPNDPDILYGYASVLADLGRLKDARRLELQVLAQEPFIPNYNRQAADVLWAMGQNDAALKMLKAMIPDQGRDVGLAKVYAAEGKYAQAADTLAAASPGATASRQALDDAARLIRSAPGHGQNAFPGLALSLNFVYLFIGAEDRYLDEVERRLQAGLTPDMFRDPWAPSSATLRKSQRFKSLLRKAGFVKYWRARGWPEFCRPLGDDDFECH